MLGSLNGWIVQLFSRGNVDRTVAALVGSQRDSRTAAPQEAAEKRLTDAEAKLRRFQAAIEAGVDLVALVEAINDAQAKREAARAELEGAAPPSAVSEAELYAMIDSLGDVGAALKYADPDHLGGLYEKLTVERVYEPTGRTVVASVSPRVVSACVRGGRAHCPYDCASKHSAVVLA